MGKIKSVEEQVNTWREDDSQDRAQWKSRASAYYVCIAAEGDKLHFVPITDEYNYTGIQPKGLIYVNSEGPALSTVGEGELIKVTFEQRYYD